LSAPAAPRFAFELSATPLDVAAVARSVPATSDGAVVVFVGIVRDKSRGRRVVRLEYEAYDSMARSEMESIFGAMRDRFGVGRARVVHRTGVCALGEPSIVIAVAAPHRAAAFDACRLCIDEIKRTVPIWKREVYADGAEWFGDRS
jgi:molybdopterin synthase catalytic subunit